MTSVRNIESAHAGNAPGTNLPDYEPGIGESPLMWADWIDWMFMEMMRYVPHSRHSKTDWIYHCLDCGESTSSGLHCDKR